MFEYAGQAAQSGNRRAVKHEFDRLHKPLHCRVAMRRATREDYEEANSQAETSIGVGLAGRDAVCRVLDRNANSILVFEVGGRIAGLWAMLPLSTAGLEALLTGDLDTRQPAADHVAALNTAPAAIYVWLVVAPGLVAEGIRHVSTFLRQPLFARANLYARPATDQGRAIILKTGFRPVGRYAPDLYRYVRQANCSSTRFSM